MIVGVFVEEYARVEGRHDSCLGRGFPRQANTTEDLSGLPAGRTCESAASHS